MNAGRELVTDASPVVALVGRPAAGKSHLAHQLSDLLGIPILDIDAQGRVGTARWPRLLDKLAAERGPCIVESCISPQPYRDLLRARGAYVIRVVTKTPVIRERLRDRDLHHVQRQRLLSITSEPPWPPDVNWDGATGVGRHRGDQHNTLDLAALAAEVESHCRQKEST